MQRIPNAGKDVLTDFVLDHVERGSEVRTDGWTGYNGRFCCSRGLVRSL
jgi:hypothetical protein